MPPVDPWADVPVVNTGLTCAGWAYVVEEKLIQSPNYGIANYSNNQQCVWSLTAPQGQVLMNIVFILTLHDWKFVGAPYKSVEIIPFFGKQKYFICVTLLRNPIICFLKM